MSKKNKQAVLAGKNSASMGMPPDTVRQPPALRTVLGWFSVGFGVLALFQPKRINRIAGLATPPTLLRLLGLREIVNGYAVLHRPSGAGPIWARLAGDAIDVSVAAKGLKGANPQIVRSFFAFGALLGIAALDLLSALNEESRKL